MVVCRVSWFSSHVCVLSLCRLLVAGREKELLLLLGRRRNVLAYAWCLLTNKLSRTILPISFLHHYWLISWLLDIEIMMMTIILMLIIDLTSSGTSMLGRCFKAQAAHLHVQTVRHLVIELKPLGKYHLLLLWLNELRRAFHTMMISLKLGSRALLAPEIILLLRLLRRVGHGALLRSVVYVITVLHWLL